MKWIFSGGVRYPVDDEARAFAAAEASKNLDTELENILSEPSDKTDNNTDNTSTTKV